MQAGAYVAYHHAVCGWNAEPYTRFKIGHSGDLARRITKYNTYSIPGCDWMYLYSLETQSKEKAYEVEQYMLERIGRIDPSREFVEIPWPKLCAFVAETAKRFGCTVQQMPKYTIVPYDPAPRESKPATCVDLPESALVGSFEKLTLNSIATGVANAPTKETQLAPVTVTQVQAPMHEPKIIKPYTVRSYQEEAIRAAVVELNATRRATLWLSCRSGKTFIATHLLWKRCWEQTQRGTVVFVIPTIVLLTQTVQNLGQYGLPPECEIVVISSDKKFIAEIITRTSLSAPGHAKQVSITPSTDVLLAESHVPRLVITTYKSAAQVQCPGVKMVVFDEAHHTCENNPSQLLVHFQEAEQLFITATPNFRRRGIEGANMADTALYGAIAYKFPLADGIKNNYVMDYNVQVCTWGMALNNDRTMSVGMSIVLEYLYGNNHNKMLVFCTQYPAPPNNDPNGGRAVVTTIAEAQAFYNLLKTTNHVQPGFENIEITFLHSNDALYAGGNYERKRIENEFREVNGKRMIVFNCDYFSEGVEVPELGVVYFASPTKSPTQIIQRACRSLTKRDGKPTAKICVPIRVTSLQIQNTQIQNPQVQNTQSQIIAQGDEGAQFLYWVLKALADDDSRALDAIFNPEKGTLVTASQWSTFAPPVVIREVHRLLRSPKTDFVQLDVMSTDIKIELLKKNVLEKHRYPKVGKVMPYTLGELTVNGAALHAELRTAYRVSGNLEPYQRRALESIPMWVELGYTRKCIPSVLLYYLAWYKAGGSLSMFYSTDMKMVLPPPVDLHMGMCTDIYRTCAEAYSNICIQLNQKDVMTENTYATGKSEDIPGLAALTFILFEWIVKFFGAGSCRKQRMNAMVIKTGEVVNMLMYTGLSDKRGEVETKPAQISGADPNLVYAQGAKMLEIIKRTNPELAQQLYPAYPTRLKYQESTHILDHRIRNGLSLTDESKPKKSSKVEEADRTNLQRDLDAYRKSNEHFAKWEHPPKAEFIDKSLQDQADQSAARLQFGNLIRFEGPISGEEVRRRCTNISVNTTMHEFVTDVITNWDTFVQTGTCKILDALRNSKLGVYEFSENNIPTQYSYRPDWKNRYNQ